MSLELNKLLLPNDVKSYWEYNSSMLVSSIKTPSMTMFTCYDDYYCNNNELANAGHIALGVFGLLLTLAGLILNILLIPVMSLVGIRSSATYYMISMAISDSCLLIIDLILVVIRYLPSYDQSDQLLMYQNFVAYFVPFGFPAKSVCQILTISLCAGLIIDRSVYEKDRKTKKIVKCSIAMKAIISIVTIMIVSKLPNFLLLKIVENYESFSTLISVRWTLLAKPWIFIFDSIIFLSVYVALLCSVTFLSYLCTRNHSIKRFDIGKAFEVPLDKRIFRRERLYLYIGLLIGILTVLMKLPHLLRYFFFGFGPMNQNIASRYTLIVVDMCMEIMDMILVVIKPTIYLVFAVHFRQALKDMIGLWVRPSLYSELKVSGGMGKTLDLRNNTEKSELCKSNTSDTLLKCCYSDNNGIFSSHSSKNCLMIDTLAQEMVSKPKGMRRNFNSASSESYLGSTASSVSESHSSNLKPTSHSSRNCLIPQSNENNLTISTERNTDRKMSRSYNISESQSGLES